MFYILEVVLAYSFLGCAFAAFIILRKKRNEANPEPWNTFKIILCTVCLIFSPYMLKAFDPTFFESKAGVILYRCTQIFGGLGILMIVGTCIVDIVLKVQEAKANKMEADLNKTKD